MKMTNKELERYERSRKKIIRFGELYAIKPAKIKEVIKEMGYIWPTRIDYQIDTGEVNEH